MKIYTTCEEIPLCKFIDMYKGNLSALIIEGKPSDDELKLASLSLIDEYSQIIGSRSLSFEIQSLTKIINYKSKIIVLDSAILNIEYNNYKEASELLEFVKVKLSCNPLDNEIEKVINQVNSMLAHTKLNLKQAELKFESRSKSQSNNTNFTEERMIISAHFKMRIDPKEYTAAEYGNLIKLMLDELKPKKNGKRD